MTIAEMVDFYNGYKFKKDAIAIIARKRDEEAEKAVNDRVFRFIFGGILPGVEPL